MAAAPDTGLLGLLAKQQGAQLDAGTAQQTLQLLRKGNQQGVHALLQARSLAVNNSADAKANKTGLTLTTNSCRFVSIPAVPTVVLPSRPATASTAGNTAHAAFTTADAHLKRKRPSKTGTYVMRQMFACFFVQHWSLNVLLMERLAVHPSV